jgi:anti-sigma factor RsiW
MKPLDHKTIDRHLDGELDPAEAEKVASALGKHPDGRKMAEETRRLGKAVRLAVEHRVEAHPPPDCWDSVEARIRKEKESRLFERVRVWFQSRFPHTPWPVWAAAGAAVVAGVALLVGLMARAPTDKKVAAKHKPTNQIVFENIDYSGLPPTVFQIPDPDGKGSTTVIWVTDDDSDEDEDGGPEDEPPTGDSI